MTFAFAFVLPNIYMLFRFNKLSAKLGQNIRGIKLLMWLSNVGSNAAYKRKTSLIVRVSIAQRQSVRVFGGKIHEISCKFERFHKSLMEIGKKSMSDQLNKWGIGVFMVCYYYPFRPWARLSWLINFPKYYGVLNATAPLIGGFIHLIIQGISNNFRQILTAQTNVTWTSYASFINKHSGQWIAILLFQHLVQSSISRQK